MSSHTGINILFLHTSHALWSLTLCSLPNLHSLLSANASSSDFTSGPLLVEDESVPPPPHHPDGLPILSLSLAATLVLAFICLCWVIQSHFTGQAQDSGSENKSLGDTECESEGEEPEEPKTRRKETERRRSPAAKQIRKRRVAVSKAWELPGG